MNRTTSGFYKLVADGLISTMSTGASPTQTITESTGVYGGNCGMSLYPARLDHSHPLNVRTTGESGLTGNINQIIMPIGTTGKIGGSPYYARQDHVHALIGTNGQASQLKQTEPHLIEWGSGDVVNDDAGGDDVPLTATWTKGVTIDKDNVPCGVKVKILTALRKDSSQDLTFWYRIFEFDSNGCLKSVSAENKSSRKAFEAS